ncbi:MAG TPA: hypothetical protein V6D22_11710 [Candidatus Obscuribacterales bacterium]
MPLKRSRLKIKNWFAALVVLFGITNIFLSAALAANAPPVRLAIVPGNGSGMEQEVADRITDQLQSNNDVKVSTVNPDWMAVVNIVDKTDNIALTIRVNGTLTIKTRDGHVIDTVSVQTNKQDFSTSVGTPQPLNRALVDAAARETIDKLVERAVNPINDAVAVEMETRAKIIQAQGLGDNDKYAEALDMLKSVGPDTPHFKGVRELMAEFQMEQDALDLMSGAKANARVGKIRQAIAQLKAISTKSKRYPPARQMIAQLSRQLGGHSTKATTVSGGSGNELKALEAQKKALDAQKAAIDAQETAIKVKSKPNK